MNYNIFIIALRRDRHWSAVIARRTGQTLRRGGTSRRGWPVRNSHLVDQRLQGDTRTQREAGRAGSSGGSAA